MDSAALARLTPVALNLAAPSPFVDWGDLGAVRCNDPFFQQTVNRWAASEPRPRLLRTDLGALADFERALGHDPDALLFHMSRCGSTLLSRLIATAPDTLTISEPQPVNALLAGAPPAADEILLAKALRCLIRALGCRRFGERFYLVKLSSWNVRRLALFRRAFPAAKIVFVQRAPAAVMASLRADPPGWLQWRSEPAAAQMLFGIAPEALPQLDDDAFAAEALAAMLDAARVAAQDGALVVDYSELPAAAWRRVAPFIGLPLTAPDVTRMRDEARYDAKHAGQRVFTGAAAERGADDAKLRELAMQIVEPVYRELDRQRRMQLNEPTALLPAQFVQAAE